MLPSRILQDVQAADTDSKGFDFARNPYRARTTWPPDFDKLSDRYQFRLERRYKRRSKLKWARPKLMITTKLIQWTGGIFVLTYGLLFMDWGDNGNAFKGLRTRFHDTFGTIARPVPPRERWQAHLPKKPED